MFAAQASAITPRASGARLGCTGTIAAAVGGDRADLAPGGAPLILKAPGFAVGAPGSTLDGSEAADAARLRLAPPTDAPMADGALLAIALVGEGATFRQVRAFVARRRYPGNGARRAVVALAASKAAS